VKEERSVPSRRAMPGTLKDENDCLSSGLLRRLSNRY
jgi:hypothetical protein